jgi:hypothetical protein
MGIRKEEVRTKSNAGIMITGVFLLLIFGVASVQAAQMSVVPAYLEVSTGENFTVNITVNNTGSETWGAQYLLHFNNTLLNATGQTKGPFLSQDGATTNVYSNEINNTVGIIKYSESRQSPSTTGVTEPGVLATITFQAIAEEDGVSELRLDKAKLTEINPLVVIYPNTSNGTVSVRAGICGDVDNDGDITVYDAKQVWKVAGEVIPPSALANEWAADVDCDGDITVYDAKQIWKVAGEVIPESDLHCC